jgi:putative endonuclease
MKRAFVYMLTNQHHTVLYTGVTTNLQLRIIQHRSGTYKSSFTKKYQVYKLVFVETFDSIVDAIAREKQIKAGSRKKKIDLINLMNPEWKELSRY